MHAVVETKMLVWIILLAGAANRSQGGAPQAAPGIGQATTGAVLAAAANTGCTSALAARGVDLVTHPCRMLIAGRVLGQGEDPPDGFNSYCFGVNGGSPAAGQVAWYTQVPGWSQIPGRNLEANLRAAEAAGAAVSADFLVVGLANRAAAVQHPEWRMLDRNGKPREYMGPLLDWNSPYWKWWVLPLFDEFARKYGRRTDSIVLWEPPIGYGSTWAQEAFCRSKQPDFQRWTQSDQVEKWHELADTLKTAGWKGHLIGGGWGTFEWEERMFNGTIERSALIWDQIDPFRQGLVPIVMPELLVHSNYGSHVYRREDLHFVYRSLMYERSVYGDNIMPNLELSWDQRVMTPDELLRWLLEAYSAGFPSYSVVCMEKLYLEKTFAHQTEFRPQWRRVFKTLNALPYLGRPVVNFQFVVSADLERVLMQTPATAWLAGGWNRELWHAGQAAGAESLATGRDYQMDQSGPNGPLTVTQKAKDVLPCLIVTVDGADCDLTLHLLDHEPGACSLWLDYSDGGSWLDYKLGDFKLSGDGALRSYTFHLPAAALAKAKDAAPAPGKQVRLRFCDATGPALSVPLRIQSLELSRNGSVVARSSLRGKTLWDWYVGELSLLFKRIDRSVCGGALVNERVVSLPDDVLYGVTGHAAQIAVQPDGYTLLKAVADRPLHRIPVRPEGDLSGLAERILSLVGPNANFTVGKKRPLVYANLTRRDDGREFLTIINHGAAPGGIEVQIPWPRVYEVVDGSVLGNATTYTYRDHVVHAEMGAREAMVLSNRRDGP